MSKALQHVPDILDCLANLSSEEVFTSPAVARRMLDLLPAEVWTNPSLRFLDPACKSGVFLREAAQRLLVGLAPALPDEQGRREHIFKHMLHGLAITDLTAQVTRRTLYYSKDASCPSSVIQMFTSDGNVDYRNVAHSFSSGSCIHCGAPDSPQMSSESGESHAYAFIHDSIPTSMKFDVIIGNPPYQLKDGEGGKGSSARPIYQHFVNKALALNPRYVVMIIPSRWFTDGKGLDEFRKQMLNDKRLKKLVDHVDATDCFPGIDLAGGVCYFLWDSHHQGLCDVTTVSGGNTTTVVRALNEHETFVRDSRALPLLYKVQSRAHSGFMSSVVSSRKPFGLDSSARPDSTGELVLMHSGGVGPLSQARVTANFNWIGKWKTIVSKVSYDHAGQADKNGHRRVLSKVGILPPGHVCTETYLVAGVFDTEADAQKLADYLKTKFVRFLISLLSATQNISKDKFGFVPVPALDASLTDEALAGRYDLSAEEQAYIASLIKEMP